MLLHAGGMALSLEPPGLAGVTLEYQQIWPQIKIKTQTNDREW